MNFLTLQTLFISPIFNPNSNQKKSKNKSQFKAPNCYLNDSPIMFKPISKTHFSKNNQNNSLIHKTNSKKQQNLPNTTSQIDLIVTKTLLQYKPNLPILSENNQIMNKKIQNQPNSPFLSENNKIIKNHLKTPIILEPNSENNKTVKNHFKKFNSRSQTKKIRSLSLEFKALNEPIERVKRLLHYASLLSPIHQSIRIESNRVTGCTTQVWLEAEIDLEGLMRFRADSDSEITKGFCYCLVWALNGSTPIEVMSVVAEDLADMNVGFSGKSVHSRVNTWQNVLVGMQKRTEALARKREREILEALPSLLLTIQDFSGTEERLLSPEVAHLS